MILDSLEANTGGLLMKYRWLVVTFSLGVFLPVAAHAQDIYGQFSASQMTSLAGTNDLYGATTGVLLDGPTLFHHMVISADIQGRFVGKSGEKLDGITAGPRFTFSEAHGISPYGEFLVGFARYNNPAEGNPTTDSTIQINAGVAKRISSHWDLSLDYSYAQYYALGGEYNPKTYSFGTVFHFKKR